MKYVQRLITCGALAVVFAASPAHAQACANVHPGRAVVDSIINLDIGRAQSLTQDWAAREPEQPLLDVFRALTEMAKPYVDDRLDRQPFWDKALAIFERIIARHEGGDLNNADQALALGLAQAYKSLIHAAQSQSIRAYGAASAGRETLESLIAARPDLGDAYVLLGMFEVVAGSVPEDQKLALKLVNFAGDRYLGVSYLERAVQNATVFAPEAARLLLMDAQLSETEMCRYAELAHQMRDTYRGNRPLQLLSQVIDLQCSLAAREGLPVEGDLGLRLGSGCAALEAGLTAGNSLATPDYHQ
ncbi:MAG: hypothetical protein ACFCUJ_13670 [Thiotrichales bacterium]